MENKTIMNKFLSIVTLLITISVFYSCNSNTYYPKDENGEKEGIWINGSRDGSNFKQEYQDGDFIKNIK